MNNKNKTIDMHLPEGECDCTPREMMGTSWWQMLGFPTECVCAQQVRAFHIERMHEALKENEKDDCDLRRLAVHSFNINSHHRALMLNYDRRPWRRDNDKRDLIAALLFCAKEFGAEKTNLICPEGVKIGDCTV